MEKRAWIISVNMGYGHQRTAFPLRNLAGGEIINANDYEGIPGRDKTIWEGTRKFYEFISRFSRIPLIGRTVFSIYDRFQKILTFYPKRDLSKPNIQLKQIFSLIRGGWGKDLIEKLKIKNRVSIYGNEGEDENGVLIAHEKLKNSLPIISTFFPPAFMAEFFDYPGEIFCMVCDTDMSRVWAPFNPKESRIKYFAPTERAAERLKLYGVKDENIFFTGYPLPLENITANPPAGGLEILKDDLKHRLFNLDPKRKYFEKYKTLIEENLGKLPEKPDHPLTIMFSVGGAGVQKEIGIKLLKCLRSHLKEGRVKVILSAGIREKVKNYFLYHVKKLKLEDSGGGQTSANSKNIRSSPPFTAPRLGYSIEILFEEKIEDYFKKFNQALKKTDILWTKPSELSFYSALGIPIIIAPPVGSQEEFNMRWLLKSGFGLLQENPKYADQWLFDWLEQGYLAEAAMQGFIEGEKLGTYKIQEIISKCFGS